MNNPHIVVDPATRRCMCGQYDGTPVTCGELLLWAGKSATLEMALLAHTVDCGDPVASEPSFSRPELLSRVRYKPVKTGFWWKIKVGDGAELYGKFYTETDAQAFCGLLRREFLNGAFVQERGECSTHEAGEPTS